eukprot:TRINITY_DN4888_c0_g1_i2.p1 TRINITY_DN4888_c0_g1~~TRINITY_DN4888_c0_g1_i2.p1  ORF type:complete len:164 (-),score=34.69 TRINITY_DN4888_c0_g1_i2:32-523(-)
MLEEDGCSISNDDLDTLYDWIYENGYFSHNFLAEVQLSKSSDIQKSITVNNQRYTVDVERFQPLEILFNPILGGHDIKSLSTLLTEVSQFHNIKRTSTPKEKSTYYDIILLGGTCYLPGFKDRLEKTYNVVNVSNQANLPFDCPSFDAALRYAIEPETYLELG